MGRRLTTGAAALVAAGAISTGIWFANDDSVAAQSDDDDTVDSPQVDTQPTTTIRSGDLVEDKETTARVDHGEAWTMPIDATGTVTKRHDEGAVVRSGDTLIWVDNLPVQMAHGDTPMYRTLEFRRDASGKFMNGDDVRQLQEFLLAAGHDDKERLDADGTFGQSTRRAVKEWQKATGRAQTGSVDRTQLVFSPTSVRIDDEPRVGTDFAGLRVTESTQRITTDVATRDRAAYPDGGAVTLEAGGQQLSGTIVDQENVLGDDGSQKIRLTIEADGRLGDDVDRVKVASTRVLERGALLVEVRAVLALAGGGYGLEVMTPAGRELRAVDILNVVDDVAAVDGDFAPGDEVLVPDDTFGGA